MDNGNKLQHDHNIPIIEEYNSSDNVMLRMEECLANSKECALTDEGQDKITTMIAYNIINNVDANIKQEFNYINGNIFPINIHNCKFVQNKKSTVLKQKITKSHRVIAPKFVDVNVIKVKNVCVESNYRKDDKRRATHNEIERRRRNKINNCIFKLKELIPEVEILNSSSEYAKCKTASADSKSQILIRAYNYIQHMQEELNSLRECVKENDQLRLNNQELHHKINELQNQVH